MHNEGPKNPELVVTGDRISELLPEVDSWAVAWTKSRAEKALTEFLAANGVKYFLPLVVKRRTYGRHIRESKLPLFPGYVFFEKGLIPNSALLASRKIAQIISTRDQQRLKNELKNIAVAVSNNPVFKEISFETRGIPVRVTKGIFSGLEGEFIRRKNRTAVVIKVTLLSRAVELGIDEACVQKM